MLRLEQRETSSSDREGWIVVSWLRSLVMNKLIAVSFLIFAILAEPALGRPVGYTRSHAAPAQNPAQKEKQTAPAHLQLSCKKYFALIGAVISVPCSG
jgi:hypothetical protein